MAGPWLALEYRPQDRSHDLEAVVDIDREEVITGRDHEVITGRGHEEIPGRDSTECSRTTGAASFRIAQGPKKDRQSKR